MVRPGPKWEDGGDKKSDSGYIFKVGPKRFDADTGKREDSNDDSKFDINKQNVGMAIYQNRKYWDERVLVRGRGLRSL